MTPIALNVVRITTPGCAAIQSGVGNAKPCESRLQTRKNRKGDEIHRNDDRDDRQREQHDELTRHASRFDLAGEEVHGAARARARFAGSEAGGWRL